MTLEEFQKKIKKDYIFDKFFNYFFAILFTFIGLIFSFGFVKMAIDSGFEKILIILFVFILWSGFTTYVGIMGFINIPKLTELHKIPNKSIEQGKNRIIKVAQKLKIDIIESDSNTIQCSTSMGWFTGAKDILFFIDENNIYLNIQPSNSHTATYLGGYYSCKKFFKKIETEFTSLDS